MTTPDRQNPQSTADLPFDVTKAPAAKVPPLSWARSKKPWQRRRWRSYWIAEPAMGSLKYLLHRVIQFAPPSVGSNIGASIAPLSQRIYRKEPFSDKISSNMRALLDPAHGHSFENAIGNWWKNTGRVYAEFASVDKIAQRLADTSNLRHDIAAITAKHDAVIYVSVHVGSWETLGAVLGLVTPKGVIGTYQPEGSRFSNHIIHEARRRRGQYVFPPGPKSAIYLARFLANKSTSGFMMIDEVHEGQIHFPLFGRTPVTMTNAARAVKLAMRTNAVLVPIALPRVSGVTFDVKVWDPIELEPLGSINATQQRTIERLNEVFEPFVKAHLDQWFMLASLDRDP